MTKHDLKEMRNLGAELGAAKAENDRLREALRPFATFEAVRSKQGGCTPKHGTVWAVASISEEAEITVEHLQAAVSALSQQAEPAPAQDEREARINEMVRVVEAITGRTCFSDQEVAIFEALATRPAQTEQQPVGRVFTDEERFRSDGKSGPVWWFGPLPAGAMLYAAPIAQTAQRGEA